LKVLVSSCLLGLGCRYDGKKVDMTEFVKEFTQKEGVEILAICPEFRVFGKAPRDKIMFDSEGEDIVFEDGTVISDLLNAQFQELMGSVKIFSPDMTILKEKSPSCGLSKVFRRDSGWHEGEGVWAEFLKKNIKCDFYNELGENFGRV